jgi:outer membrane lipoprotein-sorting protein
MNLKSTLINGFALSALLLTQFSARAVVAKAKSTTKASGKIEAVSDGELKILKTLDTTYQQKSASMKVERITKNALLEQEHKVAGHLWISSGKLRMELEGEEKTLLVVNKKSLWAVTYPPADFKDAPIQVIIADAASKKGRSKNLVTLLSQGGFLKFFMPTGVEKQPSGEVLFFLNPRQEHGDFKRAQVKVTGDGKKLITFNYWDDRDNEVRMNFSDVKFEKLMDDKLFNYTPPPNAELMNL